MGVYSEEQGERFYQHILDFECRHQGQYNEKMMGTTFGGCLEKAICSTLTNLENIFISKYLTMIFDYLCSFTIQMLLLSDHMDERTKFLCFL